MAAFKMLVTRVQTPMVHTFIEIVDRIVCCTLNELFISQLLSNISHRHTLLLTLLPDDGAA